MPNPNYNAGRRYEYARMKEWKRKGYSVSRSAGSHGSWDLYAIPLNPNWPAVGIQCKVVDTKASARRLIDRFKDNPPMLPSSHFHQVIEVFVKKDKVTIGAEV